MPKPSAYNRNPSRQAQLEATEEAGTRARDPNAPATRPTAPQGRPTSSPSKPTTLSGQMRLKKRLTKSKTTGRTTKRADLQRAAGVKPKTGK